MDFKVNEEWLKARILEQTGTSRALDITSTGEKDYSDKYGNYTLSFSVTASQTANGIVLNIRLQSRRR